MTHKDILGDEMKRFELKDSIMEGLPIVARLDGRSFSKLTKGLERPFDAGFNEAMKFTTLELAKEFNAKVAFSQSDEITLVFDKDYDLFNRKVQKMTSTLASKASVLFASKFGEAMPLATFDCRVFGVPDLETATKQVRWRELDASKNSVNVVAWVEFGTKACHGLSNRDMQEKLFTEKNINWNDLPNWQKRGNLWALKEVEHTIDDVVWNAIPVECRDLRTFTRNKLVEYTHDTPLAKRSMDNAMKVLFGITPEGFDVPE